MGKRKRDLSSRAKPIIRSLLKDNHLIIFCKQAIYVIAVPKDSRAHYNLLKYEYIEYWPGKYVAQWELYRKHEGGSTSVFFYNYKSKSQTDVIKVSKKELLKRFL